MRLDTLEDVLIDQLRDLYSAGTQVEAEIPGLIARVESASLRETLARQFDEAGRHILRLQEVLECLSASARGPRSLAMASLLREVEETLQQARPGAVLDAVIITGFRRVIHYELVGLASARQCALQLGHRRVTTLLDASIPERVAVEERLGRLSQADWQDEDAFAGAVAVMEERE